jgi:aspartokinase
MIKIIKIGGISLNNSVLYCELKDLLWHASENYFIIISALENISSLLRQAAKSAENGNKILFTEQVKEIFSIHHDFIEQNMMDKKDILSKTLSKSEENLMKALISVYLTGFLSNRILDSILSQGELLLLEILKIDMADSRYVAYKPDIFTVEGLGYQQCSKV